jgi:hypothetical protein
VVDEHVHRIGPGQSFDDDCTHIVVTGPARRHTCRRVPVPSGYWLSAGSGSRALSGSSECREPGRRSGSAPIHPAPSAHPGSCGAGSGHLAPRAPPPKRSGVVRYQMPAMLDCPASPIGGYGAVSKRVFSCL